MTKVLECRDLKQGEFNRERSPWQSNIELPPPRRLKSGYRDYPAEAVRAVLRIKQMQEVGFTLRELGCFLRLLETGPHNHVERRAYAEAKLSDIDAQIERSLRA